MTEAQVVIVLTNGGSLKFHTRQRLYEYAVGWMQCPLKVMAQAWWLLDITEVRTLPPGSAISATGEQNSSTPTGVTGGPGLPAV